MRKIFHKKAASEETESDSSAIATAAPRGAHIAAKRKKRKKKKWIIAAAVALVAVIAVLTIFRPRQSGAAIITYDETSVIASGSFSNAISATGTVESDDSHLVYSTMSYVVKDVFVEVGDRVSPDTLLCQLDTDAIAEQIETQTVSSGNSAASSAQTVKAAQDSYNAAKEAAENGTNASLVSAESAVRTAKENWDRAVKTYEDYVATMDAGMNSALIAQDSAVKNAELSLEAAKAAYRDASDALDDAQDALDDFDPDTASYDSAVSSAKSAYNKASEQADAAKQARSEAQEGLADAEAAYAGDATSENLQALTEAENACNEADNVYEAAKSALRSAQSAYEQAKGARTQYIDKTRDALEAARDAKQTALESAERGVKTAQTGYDTAVKSREAAYRSADTTLADYATSADNAYAAYQTALDSYNAAKKGVETSLQASYNSLKSAQIGANTKLSELQLENLKKDLDDASVYAEAEGTVTAVYAEVGSAGSGLLFVIENVDDLIIETTVKEYDIGSIDVGMPVTIKSEGTGDDVYEGSILSIAPTAKKNAYGETDTTGDVEFAVKVRVTSKDSRLRIGMSVRLNYIIAEAENVLSVPYDAVYTNAAGDSCVAVVEAQPKGGYLLREYVVRRGIENDTDIVISGEGLSAGMTVLSEPDKYIKYIGKSVSLAESNPFAAMMAAGY